MGVGDGNEEIGARGKELVDPFKNKDAMSTIFVFKQNDLFFSTFFFDCPFDESIFCGSLFSDTFSDLIGARG